MCCSSPKAFAGSRVFGLGLSELPGDELFFLNLSSAAATTKGEAAELTRVEAGGSQQLAEAAVFEFEHRHAGVLNLELFRVMSLDRREGRNALDRIRRR